MTDALKCCTQHQHLNLKVVRDIFSFLIVLLFVSYSIHLPLTALSFLGFSLFSLSRDIFISLETLTEYILILYILFHEKMEITKLHMCAYCHTQSRTIRARRMKILFKSNPGVIHTYSRKQGERKWKSLINWLVLTQDKAQLTWRSSAVRAALQPKVQKEDGGGEDNQETEGMRLQMSQKVTKVLKSCFFIFASLWNHKLKVNSE